MAMTYEWVFFCLTEGGSVHVGGQIMFVRVESSRSGKLRENSVEDLYAIGKVHENQE